MFDGSPTEADPALKAASDAAFAVIRRAADAACAAATVTPRPPALMVALHVWSLCHGVAALFIGPPSPGRRALPMSAEDLLEAGLLVYLRSLGLGTITSP
jgi:hypothetical protein